MTAMTLRIPPLIPGDVYEGASRLAVRREGDFAHPPGLAILSALRGMQGDASTMGWAGVLVSPNLGGSGGTAADLAAIVQGLAGSAIPIDLAPSGAAVHLLNALEGSHLAQVILREVADGEAGIVLLPAGAKLEVVVQDDRIVVRGSFEAAILAEKTHVVLQTPIDGEDALIVLSLDDRLTQGEQFVGFDGGLTTRIALDRSMDKSDCLLGSGDRVDAALRESRCLVALITCVEIERAIARLIEQLAAYLSQREQFGVPLATFQALRQRVADMYLQYRLLSCLTAQTVERWTADPSDALALVDLCASLFRAKARGIAKDAIQMHGGIGLTQELLAARLCMRVLGAETRLHATGIRGARIEAARCAS